MSESSPSVVKGSRVTLPDSLHPILPIPCVDTGVRVCVSPEFIGRSGSSFTLSVQVIDSPNPWVPPILTLIPLFHPIPFPRDSLTDLKRQGT